MSRFSSVFAGLVMFTLGVSARAGLIPIVEYRFNDSGTSSASTGSDTTAVSFLNAGGASADLHGAASSGVSGLAGDRAFNNTASTTMGGSFSSGSGGAARQPSSPLSTATDNLQSMTLTGWYRTDGPSNPIANNAVLISNVTAGGFSLHASSSGTLSLDIGSKAVSSSASYTASNTWTFFAVTYDSTVGGNNVKFYVGTTSAPVSAAGTNSQTGTTGTGTNPVTIGNTNSGNRPLDGFIDDVRVYGSTSDGSGALLPSEIESIRAGDVTNSPEPDSCLLLIVAGTATLARRRRSSPRNIDPSARGLAI